DGFRHEVALLESHLAFDAPRDTARHRVGDLLRHTMRDALIDDVFFTPRFAVRNLVRHGFGLHPAGADGNPPHAFFLYHPAGADRHLILDHLVHPTARPH